MKIRVFDGETKHGTVLDCDSFEEAEKLIRESAKKPLAILTFNDGNTPNIELNLNGNFACLEYEGERGKHYEELDDAKAIFGDDTDEELEADMQMAKMIYAPIWIAQGNQSNPVKFLAGSFKKLKRMEAERVITLQQAIECIEEFYQNKKRPERIKNWERLI